MHLTLQVLLSTEGENKSGQKYKKTYYLSKNEETWIEAARICHSQGLKFLSLETKKEMEKFFEICENNLSLFTQNDNYYTNIGGSTPDGRSKSEHNWHWLESGEKIDFELVWSWGNPNFHRADGGEHCLSIDRQDGSFKWWHSMTLHVLIRRKFSCVKNDKVNELQ